MIKYYTLLVACCLAGFIQAQSWTISGNVSDESNAPLVGVSIYLDGQFVAATDPEGNFSIEQPTRPVEVTLRYLGYYPQRKVLQAADFTGRNAALKFSMLNQSPVLDEITITAKPIEPIIEEDFTTDIYDFGFAGKNLLLLVREKKRYFLRLVENDGTVLSQVRFPENCHVLHQSCVGNYHVVGENWAWEIALKSREIDTLSRYPVKNFHQFVQPCVQQSAGKYYFIQRGLLNQSLKYLVFEKDQKPRIAFEIKDDLGDEMAQRALNDFFEGAPYIFRTPERSGDSHADETMKPWEKTGELSNVEGLIALSGYGRDQIYRISELESIRRDSVYAPMLKLGDTLCLFDHPHNRIIRFGPLLERTDILSTFYHHEKGWEKLLLQDVVTNRVFAWFSNKNGFSLTEVNTKNGKAGKAYDLSLAPYLSEKFKLRNGMLYFIGQPDVNVPNKILYKMNIFAAEQKP